MNKGKPCSTLFSRDHYEGVRMQCRELSRDELYLVLLGQISALLSNTNALPRQRSSMAFYHTHTMLARHTYTHAHTQLRTHTYIHTHTHIHVRTHTHTQTHARTHPYIHACAGVRAHIHTQGKFLS